MKKFLYTILFLGCTVSADGTGRELRRLSHFGKRLHVFLIENDGKVPGSFSDFPEGINWSSYLDDKFPKRYSVLEKNVEVTDKGKLLVIGVNPVDNGQKRYCVFMDEQSLTYVSEISEDQVSWIINKHKLSLEPFDVHLPEYHPQPVNMTLTPYMKRVLKHHESDDKRVESQKTDERVNRQATITVTLHFSDLYSSQNLMLLLMHGDTQRVYHKESRKTSIALPEIPKNSDIYVFHNNENKHSVIGFINISEQGFKNIQDDLDNNYFGRLSALFTGSVPLGDLPNDKGVKILLRSTDDDHYCWMKAINVGRQRLENNRNVWEFTGKVTPGTYTIESNLPLLNGKQVELLKGENQLSLE